MGKVFLKKKISSRIADGHPWVYTNEIGDLVGSVEAGGIVDAFSSNGSFVGRGFYNPNSEIKLRFISRKQEEIDLTFIQNKIEAAWKYRQLVGLSENCRLIDAEADGLPGLIVEKFNNYFTIQTLSLGMDKLKGLVVDVLNKLFQPKGIYERNLNSIRTLERLPLQAGFLSSEFDTKINIIDFDCSFQIDLADTKHTSYFLDRHSMRAAVLPFVKDATVLDTFCFNGSFGLIAAKNGAKRVFGIDFDKENIDSSNKNANLNNLSEKCKFVLGNAFDLLKIQDKESKQYDLVILDPPNFLRKKEAPERAELAYKELNLRAMKLTKPGGFLLTSVQSNQLTWEAFLTILQLAAKDAKKSIRMVEQIGQSKDFPIQWNMPTSEYLKAVLLQVN